MRRIHVVSDDLGWCRSHLGWLSSYAQTSHRARCGGGANRPLPRRGLVAAPRYRQRDVLVVGGRDLPGPRSKPLNRRSGRRPSSSVATARVAASSTTTTGASWTSFPVAGSQTGLWMDSIRTRSRTFPTSIQAVETSRLDAPSKSLGQNRLMSRPSVTRCGTHTRSPRPAWDSVRHRRLVTTRWVPLGEPLALPLARGPCGGRGALEGCAGLGDPWHLLRHGRLAVPPLSAHDG